ncbi:hypothetical protein ARMGADRAFT_295084 [Armillaria gallica]|uniref:Uncharacterized protein n=1 Tax=Armillaria gallica TaxID=47427 RepID=A0A2H3D9R8_ARMGA|nr:hypothetical protein ARMGADRAFT_295084 [Armillaria gallica]
MLRRIRRNKLLHSTLVRCFLAKAYIVLSILYQVRHSALFRRDYEKFTSQYLASLPETRCPTFYCHLLQIGCVLISWSDLGKSHLPVDGKRSSPMHWHASAFGSKMGRTVGINCRQVDTFKC